MDNERNYRICIHGSMKEQQSSGRRTGALVTGCRFVAGGFFFILTTVSSLKENLKKNTSKFIEDFLEISQELCYTM